MGAKRKKSRYKAFSILTFTILLLTFLYYFFIFVESKKEAFNDKAFRIVENAGNNIESKYQNYTKIVGNAFKDIVQYYNPDVKNKKPKDLRGLFTNRQVPESINVVSLSDSATGERPFAAITVHKGDSIQIDLSLDGTYSTVYYEFENLYKDVLPREFFKNYIIFSESKVYYSDVAAETIHHVTIDSIFRKVKDGPQNLFHSSDVIEIEFNNESQLLYITPLNLGNRESTYLGGIIEKSYYHSQSFKLETNTVTTISVLLVILVLSIPFIKLLLLSPDERIHMSDAILSFLVIVLASAFIILGLLAWYTESGPTSKEIEQYLKTYSQSIENSFLDEMDDILNQMELNDKQLKSTNNRNRYFKFDIPNLNTKTSCSSYNYFSLMSWVNKNGYQLAKWSTGEITPRINVKFRDYFNKPNDTKNILWSHDSLHNPSGGFYIESIFSVTTGKRYAAISRKSDAGKLKQFRIRWKDYLKDQDSLFKDDKSPSVVFLTTKLQSLSNLPIPSNIAYMVIDGKGKVLFHKNESKVLQENIIDEMNHEKALTDAIFDKREVVFRSFYNESACRVHIKPMGKLPLYLIIIKDERVKKKSDAQVLGLSAMFYLLMFIIFSFQIGLFILVDIKRNAKTKARSVPFGWMWPNPSKKWRYILLISYLVISLVIYLVGEMYDNIILTYAFFSLLVTVNIFILRRFKKFKDVYTSVKYASYFVFVIIISLLIYYASFVRFDNIFTLEWWSQHGAQRYFVVFIIISILSVYYSFSITKSHKRWSSPFAYNIWVFMFVMTLSTIPVFSFFSRAYNFEKMLYIQHAQHDLAKNIIEGGHLKNDNKYRGYERINEEYFTIVDTTKIGIESTLHNLHENEYKLISELRFKLGGKSDKSSVFKINNEQNKTISWEGDASEIKLNYHYGNLNDGNVLSITAQKLMMGPEHIMLLNKKHFEGIRLAMMIVFTLFALCLFLLVRYWSRTIFLLGIIPRLKPSVDMLVDDYEFLYLISPPYVGVSSFLKNKFKGTHQYIDTKFASLEYKKNDNSLLDIEIDGKQKVVVVADNGKKEPLEIKKKIDLISQLKVEFYKDESAIEKIVFVSQLSPHQIISFYTGELNSTENKVLVSEYFEILGDFVTAYYPMPTANMVDKKEYYQLIKKELSTVPVFNYGEYWKHIKQSDLDEEDKILNIQNKAQLYYFALWTSLEKREKFIIYDLAQDGLVNYRNVNVIYNLLSRGIVNYKGGRLKLFNQSFANFILTIIDKDESLEIEKELKTSGKWASLRLPLFTLIGGVLVFIFLTQQQALSAFMGWATAAAALIPLLTRLIGVSWTGKGKTGS